MKPVEVIINVKRIVITYSATITNSAKENVPTGIQNRDIVGTRRAHNHCATNDMACVVSL